MALAPPDLFDSRHYRRVRLPADEAETLPSWCYSSWEFFEREIDRVFKPAWNCAGRVDRCAEPGDYAALSLAGVPVILLRDDKGALRAFAVQDVAHESDVERPTEGIALEIPRAQVQAPAEVILGTDLSGNFDGFFATSRNGRQTYRR